MDGVIQSAIDRSLASVHCPTITIIITIIYGTYLLLRDDPPRRLRVPFQSIQLIDRLRQSIAPLIIIIWGYVPAPPRPPAVRSIDRSIACVSPLSYNNNNNNNNNNDDNNIGEDVPAGPIQWIDRSLASVHCPQR